MDFDDAVSLRRTLVERLGEDAGAQFAALARPGFRLDRATDAAPATGSVPPGLLNFFYLDPDVPYEQCQRVTTIGPGACRVIPADPAWAVETPAPEPARSLPGHPGRRVGPDSAPGLLGRRGHDIDMNTAGKHYAFGWPDTSYTMKVTHRDADGPAVHLLQLAEDPELGWGWGDAGSVYFTIPLSAFAAGDYTEATAVVLCC